MWNWKDECTNVSKCLSATILCPHWVTRFSPEFMTWRGVRWRGKLAFLVGQLLAYMDYDVMKDPNGVVNIWRHDFVTSPICVLDLWCRKRLLWHAWQLSDVNTRWGSFWRHEYSPERPWSHEYFPMTSKASQLSRCSFCDASDVYTCSVTSQVVVWCPWCQ